jgi:Lrp/AsnC family transcriptional regulator, leucine-responsive regulatory protein
MTHLDKADLALLGLLQQDAAQTNQALAEQVGVSPPTALRRIKRLVAEGLIERTTAVLSPERLQAATGQPQLQAVLEVTLDVQDAYAFDAFEARAQAEAAVQQCYRVASGPDFVLITTVGDMAGYQALVQRLLTTAANVRNVRALFVVKRGKFGTALPLPQGA